MISLKELAAEISKDEVDVRGRKIDIRALAARETARLSELFPRPMPPLLPSHQGRVPAENTNDPAFVAADNAWGWQRKVMEVALGCGWLTGGTLFQGDGAKEAIGRVAREVEESLTQVEIQRLWQRIRDIFDRRKDARIREALIIDAKDWETTALARVDGEEFILPEKYHETVLFAQIDMCAMFGIDPRTLDETDPGTLRILMAHYRFVKQKP